MSIDSKIKYTITIQRDDSEVRGNAIASGDPVVDKQYEDQILARLSRGQTWAWALVTVTASYKEYEEKVFLGQCSYTNQQEFKQSEYFQQMKEEARDAILSRLKKASDDYYALIN